MAPLSKQEIQAKKISNLCVKFSFALKQKEAAKEKFSQFDKLSFLQKFSLSSTGFCHHTQKLKINQNLNLKNFLCEFLKTKNFAKNGHLYNFLSKQNLFFVQFCHFYFYFLKNASFLLEWKKTSLRKKILRRIELKKD